jgi:transcriptional repressor NrdR
MLVEDVTDALESRFDYEVPSRAVGEQVMEHLKRIDSVAYIRFASVYKDLRDLTDIVAEINRLENPNRLPQ